MFYTLRNRRQAGKTSKGRKEPVREESHVYYFDMKTKPKESKAVNTANGGIIF